MLLRKFRSAPLLALLPALLSSLPARAELQDFDQDSLPAIEAALAGEPFLLLLWSVHCAPCIAELKALGEVIDDPALPPVVMVATDPASMAEEVGLVLADYGLEDVPGWRFADPMPERLRYAIDPGWYGELPRSYFYAADGTRSAHSGRLTRQHLQDWKAAND